MKLSDLNHLICDKNIHRLSTRSNFYFNWGLFQCKHSCAENFAYNLPRFSFINLDILAKLPIKKHDFSLKVALIQGKQPI